MALLTHLPRHVLDFFKEPIDEGNAHTWPLRAAIRLKKYMPREEVERIIPELFAKFAYRPAKRRECEDAIARAYAEEVTPRTPSIPWPSADPEAALRVVEKVEPVFGLRGQFEPGEVLPTLFYEGERVCVGQDLMTAVHMTVDEVSAAAPGLQFIVPSPMAKPVGLTKAGKVSARCGDAVGARRHLIVEFDCGYSLEQQTRLLTYLGGFAPLRLVVASGGKSVHGWYWVEGMEDREIMRFFARAVWLGADPKMWAPWQWCRMPGGRRFVGSEFRVQNILYFQEEIVWNS